MLDLNKKQKEETVKIGQKEYSFISHRPAKNYQLEEMANELMTRLITTEEEEAKALDDVHVYLAEIIDAPVDVINELDFDAFIAIREFLLTKPLREQGLSDREIKRLNKEALMGVATGKVKMPQK